MTTPFNPFWPAEFIDNRTDFSEASLGQCLAVQLCAWGNILMGAEPPDNFFEVMDGLSKMTSAFTPDQCQARALVMISAPK